MVDQITAAIMTSSVRIIIALFIFWLYFKNRSKLALWFGVFFILFAVHGIFRTFSILTGEVLWFFVHRLGLTFGTLAILQGLSEIGVDWIKKYKIVYVLAVVFILLSYYDAFILGGIAGEQKNIMNSLPTFAIGGLGLIMAGYYFNSLGKALNSLGRNIMVTGFTLEGLLHFAVLYMIPAGLTGLAFYLGLVFTAMIGIGWWMSLKIRAE
jgi:hypothetical protein